MDTGDLPDEIGKSRNSSKLNTNPYPSSMSQNEKGRELIRTSYAENRRGTSKEFEAWFQKGAKNF